MSPAWIIVSPLGDMILSSSLTIAPNETSFGNLISLRGFPMIDDDLSASKDITSPNSSIIDVHALFDHF